MVVPQGSEGATGESELAANEPHRPSIPLWPLALLAGALPALAALVAWGLSIRFALAP